MNSEPGYRANRKQRRTMAAKMRKKKKSTRKTKDEVFKLEAPEIQAYNQIHERLVSIEKDRQLIELEKRLWVSQVLGRRSLPQDSVLEMQPSGEVKVLPPESRPQPPQSAKPENSGKDDAS